MSSRKRNRLYRLIALSAADANLDREDRLEFARHALKDEGYGYIESLSEVETDDLEHLLSVLRGWRLIQRIRLHNGSLYKESDIIQERMKEDAFQTAERQNETGEWD